MKLKPQPGTDLLELKKLTKRMREMSPDDEKDEKMRIGKKMFPN